MQHFHVCNFGFAVHIFQASQQKYTAAAIFAKCYWYSWSYSPTGKAITHVYKLAALIKNDQQSRIAFLKINLRLHTSVVFSIPVLNNVWGTFLGNSWFSWDPTQACSCWCFVRCCQLMAASPNILSGQRYPASFPQIKCVCLKSKVFFFIKILRTDSMICVTIVIE